MAGCHFRNKRLRQITLEDKSRPFGDWSARNGGETWKAASEGGVPLRVCILKSQSFYVTVRV